MFKAAEEARDTSLWPGALVSRRITFSNGTINLKGMNLGTPLSEQMSDKILLIRQDSFIEVVAAGEQAKIVH